MYEVENTSILSAQDSLEAEIPPAGKLRVALIGVRVLGGVGERAGRIQHCASRVRAAEGRSAAAQARLAELLANAKRTSVVQKAIEVSRQVCGWRRIERLPLLARSRIGPSSPFRFRS